MATLVGIDVGTHTGVCIYNSATQKIEELFTMKLHQALERIEALNKSEQGKIIVYYEDARLRKWFGNTGRERLKGAGSVERDSTIWEEFLTDKKIPFFRVAPKHNNTKLSPEQFKMLTGYGGRCSEHARDATMLVYGR